MRLGLVLLRRGCWSLLRSSLTLLLRGLLPLLSRGCLPLRLSCWCSLSLRRSLPFRRSLALLWSRLSLLRCRRGRLPLLSGRGCLALRRSLTLWLCCWCCLPLLSCRGSLPLLSCCWSLPLWLCLTSRGCLLLRRRLTGSLLGLRSPVLFVANWLVALRMVQLVLILLSLSRLVAVTRLSGIRTVCRRSILLRSRVIPVLHACRRLDITIRSKRLTDRRGGWTAMVDIGKLLAILAGLMLVLHLSSHGGGVGLMARG